MTDRPPSRRTPPILALALLAALLAAGAAAAQQDTGTFVVLSDIHFDPLYDPELVPQLQAVDARQWQRILESSKVTRLSGYGEDTNYPLLKSALSSLRCRTPEPDFVLISGDFLRHNFPTQDKAFVRKTLEFLTLRLQATFPGIPVLPALGNNDSDCGDYTMQPGGPFLAGLAGIWRPLPGPEAGTWAQSFPAGGYYTLPHPTIPKIRLAVLNTVLFSPKYQTCGQGPADPGKDELAWLAEVLKQAAANGEKVWLLYHIPQGIDVYASLSQKQPKPMWKDEYSSGFSQLTGTGLVAASFSGHTHMDELRLPASGGFVHGTPAVSPLFGNNPGYQVFSYSRSTGALLDYRSFFLNLGAGQDPDLPWAREYDFQTAYGQSSYDRGALQSVVAGMESGAGTRNRFLLLYPATSSQGGADPCRWQAYWCGISGLTAQDFLSCLCKPGLAPWAAGSLCPPPG